MVLVVTTTLFFTVKMGFLFFTAPMLSGGVERFFALVGNGAPPSWFILSLTCFSQIGFTTSGFGLVREGQLKKMFLTHGRSK
jgi:hypothetical protein